jgi:hypothetical protein
MPTISNLSFNVRFDLTGTPTLVLTDTTTSPPAGLVGIFAITQPDGYTRTGSISTPDISVAGGSFSILLRLNSSGGLQSGTYRIVYTGNAPSYLSTDFTREFVFDYQAPSLVLTEDFDVFTPDLKYIDSTVYSKSGYTNGGITRAWTAISTPTGTITGSTATFDVVFGGQYYDANYVIALTSSLLYTNTTYNWLTVQETVNKSVNTYAETPPDVSDIVGDISDLKLQLDEAINSCQVYDDIKADFEYAQVLFLHIVDKFKVSDLDNIFTDLKDLLRVLNNYQIPAYIPTNLPIPTYDVTPFFPGAIWGNIVGTITLQTDLVSYIATQIASNKFAASVGNGSATSFAITHNLNSADIEIEVFEVSSGETVYTNIVRTSANVVTVSFATAPTTNQYRVIIMK